MKTESVLYGLAHILETHAMGDDAINEFAVVVTSISDVVETSLVITMMGNDGTEKTFLVTEVDD